MTKTLVALYDEFDQAQNAVQELVEQDFKHDHISLIANNTSGEYDHYIGDLGHETKSMREESGSARAKGAGIGAGAGAGLGGVAGLVLGLGAFAIPGVGPVVAAGPIISTLAGAGIGAAAGGLAGALSKLGVSKEEAEVYSEGVRRGGTLVVVQSADEAEKQASNILNNHKPVDIDKRANEWREHGWTGNNPNAKSHTGAKEHHHYHA